MALVLATWLSSVVAGLQPPLPIDLGLDVSPDWRVMAFTMAAAAATGILFGLIPAFRTVRGDLASALREKKGSDPLVSQRLI